LTAPAKVGCRRQKTTQMKGNSMIEADIKKLQDTVFKLQKAVADIELIDTAILEALRKRVEKLERRVKELDGVKTIRT
jgi:uncharacterized protein YlxW (UPF0749 family)